MMLEDPAMRPPIKDVLEVFNTDTIHQNETKLRSRIKSRRFFGVAQRLRTVPSIVLCHTATPT
jgi:hypothetical protein